MILSLCPYYRPGCIHRRVCTGHAIPYTYLHMWGELKITKVSFGRTPSAGLLFFLVLAGHELFRSLQHPLVPRCHIVHLRRKGPYGSVNSECEPVVRRKAVYGSERLEVILETIHPVLLRASLTWIFPPDVFSVHQPLREMPGGLSGHGSREQKSPLSNGSFHALASCRLVGLSARKLSVGAALAVVPDNSQE